MELPLGLPEKPPQDAGGPQAAGEGPASGCSAVTALEVTQEHVLSPCRWFVPLADASLLFVLTSWTPSEEALTQVPHVAVPISSACLVPSPLCSSVPPRYTALRVGDMGPPCRSSRGQSGPGEVSREPRSASPPVCLPPVGEGLCLPAHRVSATSGCRAGGWHSRNPKRDKARPTGSMDRWTLCTSGLHLWAQD